MIKHLRQGLVHTRKFLSSAYHGGRKFLQHVDIYANMAKRILAASQPMLADFGVLDVVNRTAMQGITRFDQARADLSNMQQKGEDYYSRLASAVN